MQQITVIMPFLNEGDEPVKTLTSLFASCSPEDVAVIAIEDGTATPGMFAAFPSVTHVCNNARIGVDASRNKGVSLATTPFVFIIDAHMRFTQDDWLQRLLSALRANPNTVFCTTCLALGFKDGVWHDMDDPNTEYNGATILVTNDFSAEQFTCADGTRKVGREVLEPKWQDKQDASCYDIPCVLGANYACSKAWWEHIRGMNGLLAWGSSEPFLSLKTWMAGGSCKLLTDIKIGHVFRDRAPYATPNWCISYNKVLMMMLLFPASVAEKLYATLIAGMPEPVLNEVLVYVEKMTPHIETEKRLLEQVFVRDVLSVLDQFGIKYPKVA